MFFQLPCNLKHPRCQSLLLFRLFEPKYMDMERDSNSTLEEAVDQNDHFLKRIDNLNGLWRVAQWLSSRFLLNKSKVQIPYVSILVDRMKKRPTMVPKSYFASQACVSKDLIIQSSKYIFKAFKLQIPSFSQRTFLPEYKIGYCYVMLNRLPIYLPNAIKNFPKVQ